MLPKVTVVMPSSGRSSAREAIDSVMSQSLVELELIIVLDPWQKSHPFPATWFSDDRIRIEIPSSSARPDYLPARVSRLRNYGIALARGQYIAYLDDDNWWAKNHLQTLTDLLDTDTRIGFAYSWRVIVNGVGKPVGLTMYPWSVRFNNQDQIFSKFVEYGLATSGEPWLRDTIVTETGDEVFHVDTSEFCIRKEIHDQISFREDFTLRQIIEGQGEDRVLCEELYRAGIRSRCSEEYTLFYRLGGYSNEETPADNR